MTGINLVNKNSLFFNFTSVFRSNEIKQRQTHELSFNVTSEMRPLTPPQTRTELSLRFTQPRNPVTGSHFRLQLRNDLLSPLTTEI